MVKALLDTDTVSEILNQKNATVVAHAASYLDDHGHFTFSSLTRYEALRGLKDKGAVKSLDQFERFCSHSEILPTDDAVLTRAAELWLAARRTGRPHSDADLFIASTALVHDLPLVTGNTSHFDCINGLTIQNWRQA